MDVNLGGVVLGGVVVLALEVALLAILWVRVRAFEALAVEKSVLRIDATRLAIDMIDARRPTPDDSGNIRRGSRKRRRGRGKGRRDS